jgi:hypothetical protein
VRIHDGQDHLHKQRQPAIEVGRKLPSVTRELLVRTGLRLGAVALRDQRRAELVGSVSDRFGEFGERRGDPQCRVGFDSELVVAAAQILHEGVPGHHHLRCPVGL